MQTQLNHSEQHLVTRCLCSSWCYNKYEVKKLWLCSGICCEYCLFNLILVEYHSDMIVFYSLIEIRTDLVRDDIQCFQSMSTLQNIQPFLTRHQFQYLFKIEQIDWWNEHMYEHTQTYQNIILLVKQILSYVYLYFTKLNNTHTNTHINTHTHTQMYTDKQI